MYRSFGLTDTEITILARATKKADYYYKSVKGQRLFRLDLGPVTLAFVGMSSPADHRFLDELERTTPPADRALKNPRPPAARVGGATSRAGARHARSRSTAHLVAKESRPCLADAVFFSP